MKIERVQAYKCSDGKVYGTTQEAGIVERKICMGERLETCAGFNEEEIAVIIKHYAALSEFFAADAKELLDIDGPDAF